jgi:hypothetical protein
MHDIITLKAKAFLHKTLTLLLLLILLPLAASFFFVPDLANMPYPNNHDNKTYIQ